VIRYEYQRDDDSTGDRMNLVVELSWRNGSSLVPPPTLSFGDREAGEVVCRLIGEEDDNPSPTR
jgi:hypothetical protein